VEHREPDVRKRRADTVSYVVAVGARSSAVGYTLSQGDLRSIAISAEQVGSLTRPHGGHANSAKDFALFPASRIVTLGIHRLWSSATR
jgi:hypothetical protein